MKLFIEETTLVGSPESLYGMKAFVIVLEENGNRWSNEIAIASNEGEVVKYLMTSFDTFESYVSIRKEITSYRSAV
jgi:hypothetical protein